MTGVDDSVNRAVLTGKIWTFDSWDGESINIDIYAVNEED